MPEAYIRGNTIKYLRVPDEVIDKVRDDSYNRAGNTGFQESRPLEHTNAISIIML